MKKRSLNYFIVTVSVCILIIGASISAANAEKVINLKLAFGSGPTSFTARAHKWWAGEVEKRTQGKVKISLHWGGTLATHSEMVKLIGNGAVDMGDSAWIPYNFTVFPLHSVTDGPVIWSKRPMALSLAGMQLEKEFPEVEGENSKANLKRLTWINPGVINIMMKNKPVRNIDDLKGLQIRTAGKFLQPPLVKSAGAVPVGIPFPELYDSMQKGLVDGTTGPIGMFLGQKLEEVCKYHILIGMGGDSGQGIMMNIDKYNSLPEDVKQVLIQLKEIDFPKVFIEQFAVPEYEKSIATFKEKGIETIVLSNADLDKWKNLVTMDKHRKPWLKRVTKLSGQSESKVKEILNRYQALADEYESRQTAIW